MDAIATGWEAGDAVFNDLTAETMEDMLKRVYDQMNADLFWSTTNIVSTAYVNSPFDYRGLKRVLGEMFPLVARDARQEYRAPYLYGIPLKIDPTKAQPREIVLRDGDDKLVARASIPQQRYVAGDVMFTVPDDVWRATMLKPILTGVKA